MSTPKVYGNQINTTTKAEADSILTRRLAQFPPGQSSYKASGKISAASLPLLAVALIPAALLAGLLGTIGAFLAEQIVRLMINLSIQLCGGAYLSIPLILFAVLLPATLIGVGSSFVLSYAAKRGKVRSPNLLASFAVIAAIAGMGIALFAINDRSIEITHELGYPDRMLSISGMEVDVNMIILILLLITLIGSVWTAIAVSKGSIADYKFCETCKQAMVKSELNASDWETGEKIKAMLITNPELKFARPRDMQAISQVLRSSSGSDIENTLHHCENCKRGYLENKAYFSAKSPSGIVQRNWLFSSVQTTAEESQALLASLGNAANEGAEVA